MTKSERNRLARKFENLGFWGAANKVRRGRMDSEVQQIRRIWGI